MYGLQRARGGLLIITHGRSVPTIDPRISTTPGFSDQGRNCLGWVWGGRVYLEISSGNH